MPIENFNSPVPPKESSEEMTNPEALVGVAERGPETSSQFEGSQIFTFDKGGIPVRYAVSRNEAGQLEGNSFVLQATGMAGEGEGWTDSLNAMSNLEEDNLNKVDHRIVNVQQMSESELKAVGEILGDRI